MGDMTFTAGGGGRRGQAESESEGSAELSADADWWSEGEGDSDSLAEVAPRRPVEADRADQRKEAVAAALGDDDLDEYVLSTLHDDTLPTDPPLLHCFLLPFSSKVHPKYPRRFQLEELARAAFDFPPSDDSSEDADDGEDTDDVGEDVDVEKMEDADAELASPNGLDVAPDTSVMLTPIRVPFLPVPEFSGPGLGDTGALGFGRTFAGGLDFDQASHRSSGTRLHW